MKPCLFCALILFAGCAWPTVNMNRPATTADIEKSESRIKEQVAAWNSRQAKQWEVMAATKDELARTKADLAKVTERIDNLNLLFWKVIGGGLVAGGVGGVGANAMRRRKETD